MALTSARNNNYQCIYINDSSFPKSLVMKLVSDHRTSSVENADFDI